MLLSGLVNLPWWGYLVVTFVFTHITIAAVTIYLHRHQAHRALDLHPLPSHFFRFWLWLTTGMETKAWAAIHRKHHAHCETVNDPHSPQVFGLKKVLLEGAELYKKEAKNQETLTKYGNGTPDDWLERHIYTPHSAMGIAIMLILNVLLFGGIGLTIWAIQMIWIPVFAAGIINGIGHYWGYRNFQCEDASANIVPWGILVGGEELHNNHHAYGTSAKLSNKWYEFDLGWLYIRILEVFKLAKVKKVAPKIKTVPAKASCDYETLQAIITHRYEILSKYTKTFKGIYSEEIKVLKAKAHMPDLSDLPTLRKLRHWLHLDPKAIPAQEKHKLDQLLQESRVLKTLYSMRQELAALWERSTASSEQLVKQLQDWCHRAETSGIVPLQEFSHRLRCYA